MSEPSMQAVAAHNAVRELLELLQRKGVITSEEAYAVLEQSADTARRQLDEIRAEPDDA